MAAFIPALISGVSALAGGLLNKPKTNTQTTNQTTNTNSDQSANQSMSSTPTYDPLQLQMRNFLLGQFFQRTQPGQVDALTKGYINNGVNNINDSASTNEQLIKNMLASRGLSYSGASAAPLGMAESNRIGQITNLRNQEPLIKDQYQRSNLTDFASYLSGLPTGTQGMSDSYAQNHSSQHTEGTGQVVDPGNPFGGAVSGLGSSLALMYGLGAFGNGTKKPGNMNTSGGGRMS